MNPNRKIEPEKIQVLSIKTLKGSLNAEDTVDAASVSGNHSFSFELGIGLNLAENIVGLELMVQIQATSKNGQSLAITAAYTHEFIFKVENLADFLDQDEEPDEPKLDRIMAGTLAGIAYSTVRGIVFSRTQGTLLNAVILPVIDPKSLIVEEHDEIDS